MTMRRVAEPEQEAESVTRRVKSKVPAAAAVPVKMAAPPFGAIERPLGREPAVMV
jgi:hypothetical protein